MAEEYMLDYTDPVTTTIHTHKLMYNNKYTVKYRDPDFSNEVLVKEVIDLDNVNGIVITAQQEAIIHFIDTLLVDDNVVMLDKMKDEFIRYSSKYRKILEGTL